MRDQIVVVAGMLMSFFLGAWVAVRARSGMGLTPTMRVHPTENDEAKKNTRKGMKL